MPTILLATAASAFFGFSDFFGGLAARRDSAFAVTAHAHVVGLALAAIGVLIIPSQFAAKDLMWGAGVGIAGGIGIVALYAGLACGRMGIVAPLTAALSGSLPAAYDMLRGTSVSWVGIVGLVCAVVAVVIVSATGHPEERASMPLKAVGLAVLSGVAFSVAIIFLSFTSSASGLAPLLAARAVSVPVLLLITLARSRRIVLVPEARATAYGAGALDMCANFALITAVRIGPLAIAAVLGSLYPVATILLARGVLGERMHPRQRFGVALALVAVVLTALR